MKSIPTVPLLLIGVAVVAVETARTAAASDRSGGSPPVAATGSAGKLTTAESGRETTRPPRPPKGSSILRHLDEAPSTDIPTDIPANIPTNIPTNIQTDTDTTRRELTRSDEEPGRSIFLVWALAGLAATAAIGFLRHKKKRQRGRPIDFPFAYGRHDQVGSSSARRTGRHRSRWRRWVDSW